MQTLKRGVEAYLDSAVGLIPCIVLSIHDNVANVMVTANRLAYAKGEIVGRSTAFVVPRKSVYTRGGQFFVRSYGIEEDDPQSYEQGGDYVYNDH